jgi:diguanylate cyclase (GGDEF)-like protein
VLEPGDLEFFRALAHQATATLLNVRLYQQATTDSLSQLYTRWHFQRLLGDATRRAEHRGLPASILLIDIDDFKRVNDRFGHTSGDDVIRGLGALLRRSTRAIDACFRYGGDEFAVLLADTDREGARIAADKLRAAVAERTFGEQALRVSVSIGYATTPTDAADPQELVKRADQALYHAKARGKDRTSGWSAALGAAAKRGDKLAGIVTGDFAADYKNVQLLIETIAAINATSDVGELLTLAVDKVVEATGADRGALMLADGGASPRLATVVARDRRKQDLKLVEKFSRTIPERVLQTGESVCVIDAADEGEAPRGGFSQSVAELSLRTIMCVPLATKDRSIGVIYVDSRTRSGNLRESNLPFFEGLARQVALAIENARLKARLALGGMGE